MERECLFGDSECVDPRCPKHGLPVGEQREQVNHPRHYGGDTTYEVIKVIEAWGLDKSFCLGNVLKYVGRAHQKGRQLEDLKKAAWYLNREIERIEK